MTKTGGGMQGSGTVRGFGALLALAIAFSSQGADAAASRHKMHSASPASRWGQHGRYVHRGMLRQWANVLQCVPFARENSGIELSGNAGTWWDNAEGLYQRGARPEVGSVLNFRASGRMRMGHVAVVTNVIDSRHIEIDHANWSGPGRISRDIDVVDVSSNNDWSAVRVAIGQSEDDFGSIYPTYGFIYDRPDNGILVANIGVTPAPVLNPAPSDLRPASDRIQVATAPTAPEEVAEAPDDPAPKAFRRHFGHARTRQVAHAHSHGHAASHPQVYRVIDRAAPATHHHRRHF